MRNSWLGSAGQLYPQLSQFTTPLSYQAWEDRLQHHPNEVFSHYILEGKQSGFRIGLSPGTQLQLAQSNMQSAREHPQIIDDFLLKEGTTGRILAPHTMLNTHINRFGVIPKNSQVGKWYLITDLSLPEGHRCNLS